MPQHVLALTAVRRVVSATWDEVVTWMVAKPRIRELLHPEQQVLFEYALRLREALRELSGQPAFDRLTFDASAATLGTGAAGIPRRPPIHVDTRQLFGVRAAAERSATAPDLAIAIHVLRSAPETLEFDDDGQPWNQRWLPTDLRVQGALLEADVRMLDDLSHDACDGFMFVAYSNEARRTTAVDTRDVASWASWRPVTDSLWTASRHFRPKPAR